MRTQPASQENHPAAIALPICPKIPWRLARIEILPNFRIRVEFVDGLSGIVDMAGLVHSEHAGVFATLADPAVFALATLEQGAAIWPGEVDLAPDAMHRAIKAHGKWVL